MEELKNIQFYHAFKKGKRKRQKKQRGRKWDITQSTIFIEKVKRIKERAMLIDEKLKKVS